MAIEECLRLIEAAAPGNPTSLAWDHILERDYVRLGLTDTRTVKRAMLYPGTFVMGGGKVLSEVDDGLTLALCVGDTMTQARALYADAECVRGLLGLREHGWELHPNFHFGFMETGYVWTTSTLNIESYIAYWTERIHVLTSYPRDEWDTELARLIADGVFSPADEPQFNTDFRKTQRQWATPRPTVAASRSWTETQSRDSGFPTELRAALHQALVALRERLNS